MLGGPHRIRMASATWVCLLAGAWPACSAENAVAVSVYQSFITADCPTFGGFCVGATGFIPANKSVTVRHLSCTFVTNTNPSGLGPVTLIKTKSANDRTGLMSDYFVPALVGVTNSQQIHAVNQPTQFTVTGGFRIGVYVEASAVSGLKCLISGDLI